MDTEEIESTQTSSEEQVEKVTLTEVGAPELKPELVWYREESEDDLSSPFRIKWQFFRKIYSTFFILDNKALSWSGDCPHFEKSVLFDKCKSFTFTFSRLFWERVFNETRPLNSSIRAKRAKKAKGIDW